MFMKMGEGRMKKMLGRILSFFRQHHLKDLTLTGGISSIKKWIVMFLGLGFLMRD